MAEGYFKVLTGGGDGQEAVAKRKGRGCLFIRSVEDIRKRCLIGADDVILCLDGETGKTVWKAVFPDAGINPSHQVRGWPSAKRGPHCLAAVAYGKVVGIGSAGLVHAVNVSDGQPAWEYPLSCYAKNMENKKGACAAKSMVNFNDPRTSPTFAGGLFVIPDGAKLLGLDPAKGAKKWEVPYPGGTSAPVRWVWDGKEYIIAHDRCIEPENGKVLWTISGAQHGSGTPAVGEGYLVFAGMAGRRDASGTGFSGYKITPAGAVKAWQTEPLYHGIGSCSPAILKGHVYCKIPCQNTEGFICIELASGKVAATAVNHSDSCGSAIGGDGRIFYNGSWLDADPKNFKYLPTLRGKDVPREREMGDDASYALSASSTPCLVQGRLYVRGQHSVLCFDVRKP
jgi:outer membrane protein assembly factor BamB